MTDIQLRALTKRYGPITAVEDLTFTARAGTVTGFLGPNGAGKTTALRALLGLARPTSGTALIGGRPYAEIPDPTRTVGAVLGPDAFHTGRTGRAHLEVLAIAAGLPMSRVDEVLELVDLTSAAGRRVGGWSLGMRQRLALAAALLGDPEVLVCDEPANGLDPEGIAWMRALLRGLADDGRTVLMSSHLLAEVTRTVDRIVLISGGRLRFDGPLDDLLAQAGAEGDLESAFLELTGSVTA
ncbi:ABC transporter ATP-binding protein [Cellulomonas sp. KRMCY2]|uniref:ABC transporter ATP-binding protein n=1 Tax=Cellulomonas sp. KRMCY2 TaxID=1304865 RepID=UPI0004A4B9D6|nr:ATP-binding cassette domain-containing protein [Cellulomonas sp. KRMCY2]